MPSPNIVSDEFCATAEQIFRPVDPALVPEIADVLAYWNEHDPDVIGAVADVDRTLIWCALEQSPMEHLKECADMMASLVSFRERADEFVKTKKSAA